MGKKSVSMSFKNAIIDSQHMRITEISKDSSEEFNLQAILDEWHGIEGVSFSLRQDDCIAPICEDGE